MNQIFKIRNHSLFFLHVSLKVYCIAWLMTEKSGEYIPSAQQATNKAGREETKHSLSCARANNFSNSPSRDGFFDCVPCQEQIWACFVMLKSRRWTQMRLRPRGFMIRAGARASEYVATIDIA